MEKNSGVALKREETQKEKSQTIFWVGEWERRIQAPPVVLRWMVGEGGRPSLERATVQDAVRSGATRSQV